VSASCPDVGGGCCKPVLELDFEDLSIKRDAAKTHLTVCDLHRLPSERSQEAAMRDQKYPPPRRSCFDNDMFDDFVLQGVWRPACTRNRLRGESYQTSVSRKIGDVIDLCTPSLGPSEHQLFHSTQLAVGYFNILWNLDCISLLHNKLSSPERRFMLAELVYMLGHRLTEILTELSKKFPVLTRDAVGDHSFVTSTNTVAPAEAIRPATLVHAVGILLQGMKLAYKSGWRMQLLDADHPLRRLCEELRDSSELMIRNLSEYECRLSGQYQRGRGGAPFTSLIQLLRLPNAGMPSHLLIAAHRYVPKSCAPSLRFDPFPCLNGLFGRRSVIDLLLLEEKNESLATPEDLWGSNNIALVEWITEDNRKVSKAKRENGIKNFKPVEDLGRTDTSVGYPGAATKNDLFMQNHPNPPSARGNEKIITDFAELTMNDHDQSTSSKEGQVLSLVTHTGSVKSQIPFVPPQNWSQELTDESGHPLAGGNDWNFRPDNFNSEQRKRQREDEDAAEASETPSTRRRKRHQLTQEHPGCKTIFIWQDSSSNGSSS
jgi:hypothetical protein